MPKSRVCANSKTLSRRNLLASLPAASLALSLPASAAPVEDPILPIYREWWASHVEWNRLADLPGNEEWDWPESTRAQEKEHAAMSQMLELTPSSTAGIAALAHAFWTWDGPSLRPDSPDYAEECAQTKNVMIAAIWRAASGKTGLPPCCTSALSLTERTA